LEFSEAEGSKWEVLIATGGAVEMKPKLTAEALAAKAGQFYL